MKIVSDAWRTMVRALSPDERDVGRDDRLFAAVLADSRAGRLLERALSGVAAGWHASLSRRATQRWLSCVPAEARAQVRCWATVGMVAAAVHLAALWATPTARGPLQWVLPALVMAGCAASWALARAGTARNPGA